MNRRNFMLTAPAAAVVGLVGTVKNEGKQIKVDWA
jgi:hypothetical protein